MSGRAGSGVFPMRVLRFSLPVSIFLSCRACRFADFIFFWRVDRVGRVGRVFCFVRVLRVPQILGARAAQIPGRSFP